MSMDIAERIAANAKKLQAEQAAGMQGMPQQPQAYSDPVTQGERVQSLMGINTMAGSREGDA